MLFLFDIDGTLLRGMPPPIGWLSATQRSVSMASQWRHSISVKLPV